MPDGNDQLDVVQHPTLGPLKFPKDMPFEQRNSIIADMVKSASPASRPGAIQQKKGGPILNVNPDVSKGFLDPANAAVDPDKYSRAYLAAHPTPPQEPGFLPNLVSRGRDILKSTFGVGDAYSPEDAMYPNVGKAQDVAAGRVTGSIPFVGPSIENAKNRIDAKDYTGAAGGLTADALAAAAPIAIHSALNGPAPATKGLNLLERTTSPGGMKAETQLESRLTNQRAAPYLADQERDTPVVNKQPATIGSEPNPLAGQKMGVMNYRQNAQAAAQKLWGQITPRAQMYERAPLEPTKQGVTASSAIRSSVNPTEAQLNPGKVAGVNSLADFYDKPSTVGEALDRIHELNNDKGVQAYEKATPDKQAELLKGDPTIEGKITATNTLRDQVFDSIEKHGTPEDANWIRNARQDYGAISEVGKNLGNTQVPTPVSPLTRLANSTRLILSPGFARETIAKPVSTLFDLNNPNRLALKSSQALGASDLQPPQPPPIRVTPWDPSVQPSGPVVGPQTDTPFNGKSAGPMITPPQTPVGPGPGANPALFPDIPSGQAPSVEHGAGEVPNWPPKTPDWSPAPPPAQRTSFSQYGSWNVTPPASPSTMPATEGLAPTPPTPVSSPPGAPAPSAAPSAPAAAAPAANAAPATASAPPTMPPPPPESPVPVEDAMEAARRGAPGINPTLRSIARNRERLARIGDYQ